MTIIGIFLSTRAHDRGPASSSAPSRLVFSHLPDLWAWSVGLCCGETDPGRVSGVAGPRDDCRMDLLQNGLSWTHVPDVCCTRCIEMVCARRRGNNNMTHET